MRSIYKLDTPCVLIDEVILKKNIERIQCKADEAGTKVRPHIKTHKSFNIAHQQLRAGAIGITCSTVSEAISFLRNGFTDITLAYPVVQEKKLNKLLLLARRKQAILSLIVDTWMGLSLLLKTIKRHRISVGVFVKIDVGLHRCGLAPNDPLILKIARVIQNDPSLEFKGLLSHAGHAYGAKDKEGVSKIARQEIQLLRNVKKHLQKNQISVSEISIGSTPTVLAASFYKGITEVRPGNYVFMDRTSLRLKLVKRKDIALSVLATVISQNEDYYIIDAGSKTLSSDIGAHGTTGMHGYGLAYTVNHFPQKKHELFIEKLSEEHGFVRKNGKNLLKTGNQLRIIPNHSCVVMNLTNSFCLVNGGEVIAKLSVDARGKVM